MDKYKFYKKIHIKRYLDISFYKKTLYINLYIIFQSNNFLNNYLLYVLGEGLSNTIVS